MTLPKPLSTSLTLRQDMVREGRESALNMQQWESTDETMSMSEALAAISDEKFVQTPRNPRPGSAQSVALALDVLETPEVFEIHASVPGLAPEAIDITVLGDGVRIAGEQTTIDTGRATEESDYRWLVRERHVGRFDRSVTLPAPIKVNEASAESRDGVLVITLPKEPAFRMTTIPVRAGAGADGSAVVEIEQSR